MAVSRRFAIVIPALALALISAVLIAGPAAADEQPDCKQCHGYLFEGMKTVHPALEMGCTTCHSGISDANVIPHKKSNSIDHGLSSEQPELCYGCHDKAVFTKRTVHPAIMMGCTACHNPHASNNDKLLASPVPDICFTCHDKSGFTRKNIHPPVEAGMCLTCHNPHSTKKEGLLVKSPDDVCLDCHGDIIKQPHVIAGINRSGHPLGLRTAAKKKFRHLKDPVRKGRVFSCASCHNPHSSDSPHLFRYPANSAMDLCKNCHP